MQARNGNVIGLLTLATLVAVAGCSRLTFIKPKFKNDYHRTAPEYNVREDPADAQRMLAIDRVSLAQQDLGAGQLDQAEAEARKALKADPRSANAYSLLGMIEEQRGHEAQAGVHYAKAVALAPTSGALLNNYGAWLCGSGQAAASLPLFDRALADPAYPTPAAALANAGSCALRAGQTERARGNLSQALELDPVNPVGLAAMAESEYRAGRYLEARAFSERRLAVAPASVQVLQLASQIEQKLGDTAAAARYVQRIGTEFPQTRAAPPGDSIQR
jgi:type IV pilus assembly protein PilF